MKALSGSIEAMKRRPVISGLAPILEWVILFEPLWGWAMIKLLVVGALISFGVCGSAFADDKPAPPLVKHTRYYQETNPYCGYRCGCPIVTYVRHRALGRAYPSGFDPRTKEEPHYYYGAMRTHARFERWSPEL